MNLTINSIAKRVGCTANTAKIYLCRSEFAHICNYRGIVSNIELKDIERLKVIYKKATRKLKIKVDKQNKI
jgi:hypothetical protein